MPYCIHVNVKAVAVHDNGNGTFTIAIPAREISFEHDKMLDELFPHTRHKVHDLLSTEALLGSMANESDLTRAPLDYDQQRDQRDENEQMTRNHEHRLAQAHPAQPAPQPVKKKL